MGKQLYYKSVTRAQWKTPRETSPGINGNVTQHPTPQGWGQRHIRQVALERTLKPNPEGTVSARQKERGGGGSQAEGIGEGSGQNEALSWLKQVARRLLMGHGLIQCGPDVVDRWVHPVRLVPLPWQTVIRDAQWK